MKIVGIIVEYNPLHNGHIYHFNTIKKQSNANLVIAVMSSSVVNRGEPAVFTKFDRSKLALEMGVDLVIELPSVYSMQSADTFGKRAVMALNELNVNEIWIGSERNDTSIYDSYYKAINSDTYNSLIKSYLDSGLSYKASSNKALESFNLEPLDSNDTLALSYYSAIKELNSNIVLHTIKREGNNYLDKSLSDNISSATSIRLNQDNIKSQVPNFVYDLYKDKGFIDNNKLFNYIKINILNNNNLSNLAFISEGFENSLKNVYKYNDLDSFIESLNTKRYTNTRIKRVLLAVLFNITKNELQQANMYDKPIIRILGYNSLGKSYISDIKKNIELYTNIKENINIVFDIEMRISKILDTIYNTNLLELEQKGPTKM